MLSRNQGDVLIENLAHLFLQRKLVYRKLMNLYEKYVLPQVVNWACKQETSMRQRLKVIPLATGKVLEIGIGSGLNLSSYNDNVEHLIAIDPSREMWKQNDIDTEKLPFDFFLCRGNGRKYSGRR